jgi:hypothetical protein
MRTTGLECSKRLGNVAAQSAALQAPDATRGIHATLQLFGVVTAEAKCGRPPEWLHLRKGDGSISQKRVLTAGRDASERFGQQMK